MKAYRNKKNKNVKSCKAIQFDGSISLLEKYNIRAVKKNPLKSQYFFQSEKYGDVEVFIGSWIVEEIYQGVKLTIYISDWNFKNKYEEV